MTHTLLALLSVVSAASRPTRVDIGEAGVSIVPPISWSESTSTAFGIGKSFNASAGLPGQTEVQSGVRSWLAPAGSDGQPALHVQWIVGKQPSDPTQIGAIARTLLDDTRERPRQADRKAFELVAWQEARDGEVASGVLEHVNPELELRTLARSLVFVDGAGRFHEVRLECLMADGEWARPEAGDGSPRAACEAALASAAVLDAQAKKLTPLGELPGAGTLKITAPAEPPHAMQLETPEPGASLRAEGQGGKVITEKPETSSPAGTESRTSRMILVAGGAAIIVALALTMGKKRRPTS
jgi:hypothetical protein